MMVTAIRRCKAASGAQVVDGLNGFLLTSPTQLAFVLVRILVAM